MICRVRVRVNLCTSLKSTIVIDSPQRHVAPTSRLLFVSIMDECDDVMTCLHSAHTLAVATCRPCDFDTCRCTPCHFVGH